MKGSIAAAQLLLMRGRPDVHGGTAAYHNLVQMLQHTWVGKGAQAPIMCLLIGAWLNLELVQPELISLVLRLVQLAGLVRARLLQQVKT
jgi:hypothetical protein